MTRPRPSPRASLQPVGLDVFDVVSVSEADVEMGDESFRLRFEITRSRKDRRRYRAHLLRAELYRIQPTSPQSKGQPRHQPSDELIWVDWTSILRGYDTPYRARSPAEAEQRVLLETGAFLSHSRGECEGKEGHIWGQCGGSAPASQNNEMHLTRSAMAKRRGPRR